MTMRFSDEELHKLNEDVKGLIREFDSYKMRNDLQMNEILSSIKNLEESTKGVVSLFKEGKIGQIWLVRFGKFILWLAAIYGGVKLLFFNNLIKW
jgi:hypothetical protein